MNKFLFMICTAFIFSSCEKFPTSWSTEPDLSENKGNLLTSQIPTNWTTLIWSKNTDEIITAGVFGIKAINVSDHKIRSIEDSAAVYHIKLSEDGNKLYYLPGDFLFTTEPVSLYEIPLQGKECNCVLKNVFNTSFVLSPDSLIAYCGSYDNSIYLYSVNSKSNTFLASGKLITFSPDGKQFLYKADSSFYSISIKTKTVQRMSIPKDIFFINMIHWDGNGIQIFYRGQDLFNYYFTNIITNETAKLWELKTGEYPNNLNFAWSKDGRKVAFWTTKCLKSEDLFSCEIVQKNLHVVNINERKETRIAYANDLFESFIEFSPDGNKIAYILGTYIYTKDIP